MVIKNACIVAATLGAIVLGLQALDARPSHRLEGGDPESSSDVRQNTNAAKVDLGQDTKMADKSELTAEQEKLKKEFPELFSTKGQIVSFTATWCGPCRRFKPQLEALKGRFNVLVYDIDTKHGRKLYDHFKCEGVPTTLIVVKGKEKKRWVGYTPARTIQQFAVEARKVKNENDETNRINIGPLRIDWDDGVDIWFERRERERRHRDRRT